MHSIKVLMAKSVIDKRSEEVRKGMTDWTGLASQRVCM
jgi:hypothetical protein